MPYLRTCNYWSKKKGNGGYYTYYNCCDTPKHIRARADEANDRFVQYVSHLKPRKEVLELYKEILLDIHGEGERNKKKEVNALKEELMRNKVKLAKVEDMYVEGEIDKDDYIRMKTRIKAEVENIKKKIDILDNADKSEIKPKLKYSIELLDNIGNFVQNAPVAVKIKVLGSMFPEKIEFDGKKYRTKEYNKILDVIFHETKHLQGGKRKKKRRKITLPPIQYPEPEHNRL